MHPAPPPVPGPARPEPGARSVGSGPQVTHQLAHARVLKSHMPAVVSPPTGYGRQSAPAQSAVPAAALQRERVSIGHVGETPLLDHVGDKALLPSVLVFVLWEGMQ